MASGAPAGGALAGWAGKTLRAGYFVEQLPLRVRRRCISECHADKEFVAIGKSVCCHMTGCQPHPIVVRVSCERVLQRLGGVGHDANKRILVPGPVDYFLCAAGFYPRTDVNRVGLEFAIASSVRLLRGQRSPRPSFDDGKVRLCRIAREILG